MQSILTDHGGHREHRAVRADFVVNGNSHRQFVSGLKLARADRQAAQATLIDFGAKIRLLTGRRREITFVGNCRVLGITQGTSSV